jgi:excinuclease ABC subunit C
VLLRDDKSFPEIVIRRDHAAPQLRKHRGARTIKGDYFGPFASAGAVNRTLNTLQKAFLLRSCSDSVYESRTRPCMLHQIKRCAAPCTGLIALADYAEAGRGVRGLPARQEPGGDAALSRRCSRRPSDLEFERAARLRDRIRALSSVQDHPGQSRDGRRGRRLRPVRRGRPGLRPGVLLPRRPELGQPRLLPAGRQVRQRRRGDGAFLGQFYDDDRPIPKLILVNVQPCRARAAGRGLA